MSIPLNSNYICTSDLESVFLDKLTGLPLAAGYVQFFIDGSNTPKEVFTTTGSPPTGFVSLGTTVTLDSIGQYSNGATSVVVYYYPYDTAGALELYACKVYSSDNILQFTREAWPPLASNLAPAPGTDSGVQNYIPNGQFLAHNPAGGYFTDITSESGITITQIAQGGWSFKHTTAGTGVYTVTFNTENFATGLLDAPPYSVNIVCSAFDSSDVIRDLVIQWPNVNTFSRKGVTAEFNLFFKARLNTGSTETFNIYVIRNYGTGGSSTDTSAPQAITVTTSYTTPFNIQILMDDNSGKTIGAGSFIAIAIRGPSNTYSARFTDFALTLGAANLTSFPIITNDEQLSRGVAGWMPTPAADGSDLYLPLVLTDKGMTFDHSIVGQIIGKDQLVAVGNELLMDGASYVASSYSSLGIPYSRLRDYLVLNSQVGQISTAIIPAATIPMHGTGQNFVTLFAVNLQPTEFYVQINTASAGGSATQVSGSITIAATSANIYYTATVASVPVASDHWTFTDGLSHLVYNVWYSVNGAGTAPATPTGANIEVKLVTGDTTATTATKTIATVDQYQFAVLDARGYFWRSLDLTGTIDTDVNTRFKSGVVFNGGDYTGPVVGSQEAAAYLQHTHTPLSPSTAFIVKLAGGGGIPGGGTNDVNSVATTGNASPGAGTETRPINLALNWFIKY